jgi:hypothetical protein
MTKRPLKVDDSNINVVDVKRARKRAQNRESQKKYRERQQRRITDLENQLEIMKAALKCKESQSNTGEPDLISSLMAENERLRSCLVDQQVKLSSISSLFSDLVANSTAVLGTISENTLEARAEFDGKKTIKSPIEPDGQNGTESDVAEIANSDTISSMEFEYETKTDSDDIDFADSDDVVDQVTVDHPGDLQVLYPGTCNESSSRFSIDYSTSMTSRVTDVTDLTDQPSPFTQLTNLMRGPSGVLPKSPGAKYPSLECLDFIGTRLRNLLKQVSTRDSQYAAITNRLLYAHSSLLQRRDRNFRVFSLSLGGENWLTATLKWDIQRTPESYQLIPAPFQPTPYQLMTVGTYNPYINFAPWPEVRDRMIYHQDKYILEELVAVAHEYIVVETPVGACRIRDYERLVGGSELWRVEGGDRSYTGVYLAGLLVDAGIENSLCWKIHKKIDEWFPWMCPRNLTTTMPIFDPVADSYEVLASGEI